MTRLPPESKIANVLEIVGLLIEVNEDKRVVSACLRAPNLADAIDLHRRSPTHSVGTGLTRKVHRQWSSQCQSSKLPRREANESRRQPRSQCPTFPRAAG